MGKPKIRFKGYTEDWEQRKLGELASSFEYGLNAAAKEYDGENKYIRITDIDDNTHEFLTDNLTSPDIELTGADNYKLTEGDILFARTGASVGKSYIYKNSDGLVYYAGFLIRARIKEEYDTEFVFQNTLTDRYNKYIAVTSQRSGQPGVNAQEYAEFEIKVPKKEEQTKIGTYFRNIDNLITLHQRKCDEAKKLKKCMLQKMFPKDGEKVPEIRFSGFTGDWKQRKLGDVFKEYSEKNHAEQPALTLMQGEGTIKREDSERNLLYNKSNLSSYKMVYQDDFIVHLRSFEGGLEKASCNGIVSPAYHIFHGEKADSRFYYSYFRSYEFIKRKLVPHIYGIRDGRSIDIAGMKTIDIPYPSFEEQRRIGDYLDSVNNLITFHHRKSNLFNKTCRNAWEQRKFGDLGSVAMCKRVFKEQTTPVGEIPFYKIGTFGAEPDAFISRELFEEYKSKFQYPNVGDMLISASGTIGRTVEYSGEEAYFQDSNIVWFKHDDRIDNSFLRCIYNIVKWNGIEGSTIKRLYNDNFLKTEFYMPTTGEQAKIGAYFRSLDHLITLHQRKCDEAKKLKKCMLQKMFPKDGEKVPEIRFSGFTGDWKQRKLGDVFKEYSEKNHAEQPALTLMQGEGTIKREDSERNLLYNKSNLSSYKMVYQDDFIVHLRSFEGGLEKASCNGIVSPAYHIFHGEKADSRFYYSYFRSYEFIKRKLVPHIYGIRDGRSIDIAGMKTIDIPYPSFEEQRRIGDYLDSVNNLITFHQQKCDELKNIKKFMLQNMFVSEK